jgi:hypothetical protein
MLITWFAVLVMLLGLVLYYLPPSASGKRQSIGFAMFCVGLFFVVWVAGPRTTIHIP